MKKLHFVILANEAKEDHIPWVNACENKSRSVDYSIIDLTSYDWFDKIIENASAHYFLARPPGLTASYKQLYDERLYIIANILKLPVYPTFEECLVYENKRMLASWLQAFKVAHPKTFVFYHQSEAMKFIQDTSWPLVAKLNIGAAGSGITILHNYLEAKSYISNVFSAAGVIRRWGPNFQKGGIIRRGFKYLLHPGSIHKKAKIYSQVRKDVQKGFILLQEFVPHDYEWRCVRIGKSFFAHKKLVVGEKASGALIKSYENPPMQLLNFVKSMTDEMEFYSQAVDLFEKNSVDYLVNEMQCIFGQSDPYQMLVDGKPGRYIFIDNQWIFEEGDFARNACFDLRLDYVIEKIFSTNLNDHHPL